MTNGHAADASGLHTFRGRSLEEVLPQIRAELGPDAVIIRQRDGLVGGIGGFFQQQFVEVQARAGSARIDLYDEEPALPPVPAAPAAAPSPAPAGASPYVAGAYYETNAPAPRIAPDPRAVSVESPEPVAPEALLPPEPAAPAAEPAPARVPGSRPKPKLSAAELLAQATGAKPGDTRTPAEILRAHSATFAQQLAAAEDLAEPVVSRAAPAPAPARRARKAPSARYAPPVEEAPARPQAFAPPLPAAEVAPAPVAAAAPAPAPTPAPAKRARRAAKRRAARAATARAAPRAAARAPAAPAPAAAPEATDPADGGPQLPESGVGPQTTQALELAAAIAANMSAVKQARDEQEARLAPRAAARTGAPALPVPAPRRPAPALAKAQRRSLFGRRKPAVSRARRAIETPAAVAVSTRLSIRGIESSTTRELLLDATAHVLPFTPGGDVAAAARAALARRIPTLPAPRAGGRAVAFVGAGGSGKTRCSAGLAAAYATGSTMPVACLTLAPADNGAELATLLKPHGVSVEVVETVEQAARRIGELRDSALVVLDTPAVTDAASVEQLAAELQQLELDEVQLTVPATLSAAVAQEQVERLAPLQPSGIAMTHGDATDHIGAVVELACATRLPLAYVNDGLELPGSFAPADPSRIAERLLS
ncbi:hypothetical protein Q5424_17080 [Conexibacter sp. JD483]|uniref:hypothetical protein n=1 Tax=unclassified Conexibacter TaxID=2627773 RepID=UPI002720E1AB|nr:MULTISPECIES: hypothetical protein [unclassified Conexibacter]MDO8188221.1 hypothetical protein [Conexibacter sp. CPCC 205706]MDO8201815.1 hypothetical protein [Conexibacter sp. CPCC 205762]MDR9370813.1 hypothetical protein [Conexibacter sp. JD483]